MHAAIDQVAACAVHGFSTMKQWYEIPGHPGARWLAPMLVVLVAMVLGVFLMMAFPFQATRF